MHGHLVDLARARRLPDWQSWQQLTAHAPPFLSPEFFALVAPLADHPAIVAEAWDGERMVGALPLLRAGDRLEALSCDYTPGYDYCGNADGVAAIWGALRRDPSWHQLVFKRIPSASLLATCLPTLANAAGCPVVSRGRSHARCCSTAWTAQGRATSSPAAVATVR